jgi:pectin methylesterase-like acyl-CoA thioesterase
MEQRQRLGRDPDQNEELFALAAVSDENRAHIFWDCPTVQESIRYYVLNLWNLPQIDKRSFLMGRNANNKELAQIFQLANMYVRHKIWNYKLAGILPKNGTIVHEVQDFLNNFCAFPARRGMLPLVRQLFSEPAL